MPRGKAYDPGTIAAAIAAVCVEGKRPSTVARQMGLRATTIHRWIKLHGPKQNTRTKQELSDLIYDACVDTIQSLRARALQTRDPAWIARQTGADIAALDGAQWDRLIRVIHSFRPVTDDTPADDTGDDPGVGSALDTTRRRAS